MNPNAREFTPSMGPKTKPTPLRRPPDTAGEIGQADNHRVSGHRSGNLVGERLHPESSQPRSLVSSRDEHGQLHALPQLQPHVQAPRPSQFHPSAAIGQAPSIPSHVDSGGYEHTGPVSYIDDADAFHPGFMLHPMPWAIDEYFGSPCSLYDPALTFDAVPQRLPLDQSFFPSAGRPSQTTASATRHAFDHQVGARQVDGEGPFASGGQWMQPWVMPGYETVAGPQYAPQFLQEPPGPSWWPPAAGEESLRAHVGQAAPPVLTRGRQGGRQGPRQSMAVQHGSIRHEPVPASAFPSSSSRPPRDHAQSYASATRTRSQHSFPTAPEISGRGSMLPQQQRPQQRQQISLRNPPGTSDHRLSAAFGGASSTQQVRPETQFTVGQEANLGQASEPGPRPRGRRGSRDANVSTARQCPDTTGDQPRGVEPPLAYRQSTADAPACQYYTARVKPLGSPNSSENGSSQLADTVSSADSAASREVGLSAEAASWSRSKRWMSNEMKERVAFIKMTTNLRHMKAEKSPFVPQSLTELAAFKAEVADANRKKLENAVGRRQAELQLRRQHVLQQGEAATWSDVQVGKLFRGKQFHDGKSPVFASDTCFNELAGHSETRSDWPSLTELKGESDKRGENIPRRLPPPRPRNPRASTTEGQGAAGRRELEAGNLARRDLSSASIMPRVQTSGGGSVPHATTTTAEQELRLEEVPGHLQETMRDISQAFFDVDNS
ncbi:hypothetical protein CP533_5512 [Ophiocordyceps camponoti-saundersi (nom. inval.)]|nr:hypothetical protein CP533_5512 [Ophiocordyceps camponoti-saundersi (nom. inval.)]